VRLVIIDSSLGWLGQRCSAQLGSWLLAVGSQLVAPSPIPGLSQRRAWPSTTEPPKGTSEHHWHHHRGYVSSHLIARRAYVDLLVDFYMKLSYLSYNYETTWLRIRVRVFLIQQLSDSAIFTHEPFAFWANFDSNTLFGPPTSASHIGFMALRIRRGGSHRFKSPL